jgi:Na+-driven multidrug efflux pump
MRIGALGGTISDPVIGFVASGKFGTSSAWSRSAGRKKKRKVQTITVRSLFITHLMMLLIWLTANS